MKKLLTPKIIISVLAVFIPLIILAGWLYFVNSLEKNFQTLISAYPDLDIEYASMKTNPLRGRVTLDQSRILYNSDIEIRARAIVVQDLLIVEKKPLRMTLKAKDMQIVELFPSLGLVREIELSGTRLSGINGSIKYEYRPEEHILHFPGIILENKDAGLFCAELILSNLNMDYLFNQKNPFLLAAALLGIRIDYFQAGYEDYGMIKRLAKFRQAQNQPDLEPGQDQDSQSPGAVLDELFEDRENNPVDKLMGEQKPLTIRLTPQAPVPVSAILASSSAAAAAQLLGLHISNQRPDFCN
jgi:hypothetical protein